MSWCNYCTLKHIKKNKPKGSTVIVVGGDVYIVPKGEELDTGSPDDGNTQWRCWLMSIPLHCVC